MIVIYLHFHSIFSFHVQYITVVAADILGVNYKILHGKKEVCNRLVRVVAYFGVNRGLSVSSICTD